MDRITSSQVSDLMEAYAAVYAPQEITEEQVWEEVEAWVNSLVEEGHDLSEYTWEDMYEAYIEEQGGRAARPSNPALSQNPIAKFIRGELGQNRNTGSSAPRNRPGGGTTSATRPQIGSLPANARQVTQYPQGVSTGVGGGNAAASRPAPAPAARPAAPAARPVAAAPRPAATARPAAPAPKVAPAAPSIERRTPTSAELRQAQQLRTTGSNLSGTGALAPKPAAPAATPAPAPAAAPKPSLQQSIRNRRLNMNLDLFDVIKGHLLDEGYADTEEAALKIMANMSEEWKQSIVEADSVEAMRARAAKRREQRYGKQGGGGRDDFRPYTEDDYKKPGSGAASQAKDA